MGGYVREFKRRRKALSWRPIGVLVWIFTTSVAIRDFIKNTGELSLPVFVLFAISLALLMLIPVPAIRSFGLRAASFFLDVLILVLTTLGAVFILTLLEVYKETAVALAIATWLWFAYFALCDYLFGGTPGKLILGLRVISLRKRRLGWPSCLLRTLLTIPVPLIAASYASHVFDLLDSRLSFFFAMFLRYSVVWLIPVSMLFYGQDQSVVDVILGTAVRRYDQHTAKVQARSIRAGTLLSLATALTLGFVLAGGSYAVTPALFNKNLERPSGARIWLSRNESAPELTEAVSTGLRDPSNLIADVEIYQNTNEPEPVAEESDRAGVPDLTEAYAKATEVPLLDVIFYSPTSSLVKAIVLENAGAALRSAIRANDKPAFATVQLASFMHAGPLRFEYDERFLFCSLPSGKGTLTFYADLEHPDVLSMKWSLDFFRYLALFNLKYAEEWRPYI